MEPLNSPKCTDIGNKLSGFDRSSILKLCSGLLTIPELSANSVRLETLVHLALIYSRGKKVPTRTLLRNILNVEMRNSMISMMEDPIEDVFVSNIQTNGGDCLVFNGLWEGNDYFIQTLIDLVDKSPVPEAMEKAKGCCIALINLSNEIAKRCNLSRNVSSESLPKGPMNIPVSSQLASLSKRVCFTKDELSNANIKIEDLTPFIISDEELKRLGLETIGNTKLESKPDNYIVTLPSAIGVAVRKFFLKECHKEGLLGAFQSVLAKYQAFQLKSEILREFKGKAESLKQDLKETPNLPPFTSLLLKNSSDEYFHFLIIHDDLNELIEQGLDSIHSLNEHSEVAIYDFILETSELCKAQKGFHEGTTICIHGGLGRGFGLGFEKWPDSWGFVAVSLADLSLLGVAGGKPIEELVYSAKQSRWIQDNGVNLNNFNGDINFYGFWKDNNFECCPREISLDSHNHITLGTDYVFNVRSELRTLSDKHCAIDAFGHWVRCERLTKDSYFEGMKSLPLYGCVDHIDNGYLNGLISLDFANIWFGIDQFPVNIDRGTIYEWWSGFINLLCDCLVFINSKMDVCCEKPIQVNLELSSLNADSDLQLDSEKQRGIKMHFDSNVALLTLEANFLANFGQVENIGEYKVMNAVLSAICEILLAEEVDISPYIKGAIEHVLADSGVRVVHLYRTFDTTEHILMKAAGKPTYFYQPEAVFQGLIIRNSINEYNKTLTNKQDCGKYLHTSVDQIWRKIKQILKNTNKHSLIVDLVKNINSIEQDRQQWKRTAKAVQAIHQKHDDVALVAGSLETKRSLTSLCCRVLLEMSVCECPQDGAENSTRSKLRSLLSLCSLLVNTASDSDAINSDLVDPILKMHPNGSYEIPTDIWSTVLQPYYAGHFQFQFQKSVERYGELYTQKEPKRAELNIFEEDFTEAFELEYGFTPTQYIDCIAEIIDQIILSGSEYISISQEELISRIHTHREIPKQVIKSFIKHFSLQIRKNWDKPPKSYVFKDIAPWKHKRRLSCLIRPLLEVSANELFCSISLIKLSSMYFLDRTMDGEFIPEFYESDKMRSYVGKMIDKRGADYTNTIKNYFLNNGWLAISEVLMPTLGAPQELGDVDVLVLSNDGRLIAIECKNLQMAKTISEVADVLNRFKGHGENDELLKHIKRVKWITENFDLVKERISFKGEITSFEHYLITNTEMPMKYASGLPINSQLIKSFKSLEEIVNNSYRSVV